MRTTRAFQRVRDSRRPVAVSERKCSAGSLFAGNMACGVSGTNLTSRPGNNANPPPNHPPPRPSPPPPAQNRMGHPTPPAPPPRTGPPSPPPPPPARDARNSRALGRSWRAACPGRRRRTRTRVVAGGPLEVVRQRPGEVALHAREAVAHRAAQHPQVFEQVARGAGRRRRRPVRSRSRRAAAGSSRRCAARCGNLRIDLPAEVGARGGAGRRRGFCGRRYVLSGRKSNSAIVELAGARQPGDPAAEVVVEPDEVGPAAQVAAPLAGLDAAVDVGVDLDPAPTASRNRRLKT